MWMSVGEPIFKNVTAEPLLFTGVQLTELRPVDGTLNKHARVTTQF